MPKAYFDDMYRDQADPWHFDSSWYEARKHALTIAALPKERYRRAVEPGCANGALTELLAPRCDEVHAFDFVESTVHRSRARLASVPNAHVSVGSFPEVWPSGGGDLVVWSEIAYYLDAAGRSAAASSLDDWLDDGGTLISVHYTGITNYPTTGAAVATWIDTLPTLSRTSTLVDEQFELGVWTKQ